MHFYESSCVRDFLQKAAAHSETVKIHNFYVSGCEIQFRSMHFSLEANQSATQDVSQNQIAPVGDLNSSVNCCYVLVGVQRTEIYQKNKLTLLNLLQID